MIWRWWIFEGDDRSHIDTGVVVEGDREKAEAAAKDAIEHRLGRKQTIRRPHGAVPAVWPQLPRGPRGFWQGHPPNAHTSIVRNRIRSADDNAPNTRREMSDIVEMIEALESRSQARPTTHLRAQLCPIC
jgi:hypothetical protein